MYAEWESAHKELPHCPLCQSANIVMEARYHFTQLGVPCTVNDGSQAYRCSNCKHDFWLAPIFKDGQCVGYRVPYNF